MTSLSGIIVSFAVALFLYANFGLAPAIAGGLVSLLLVYRLHVSMKRDPNESDE